MGAFVFTVTTSVTDDRDLIESLFRDMPEPGPSETQIAEYTILRSGADGSAWTVVGPLLDEVMLSNLESVLSLLMGAVNRCGLDAEPEHLHLHAALATKEGRAVVIAAEAHTGKTTTVAHLAAHGWGFVTDENVRLSPGAAEVTGLSKPLSFKPGGLGLVQHLEPWLIPPIDDGPEDFRFVPISASGATVVEGGTPHVVVLLRRPPFATPGSGPNAHRLHPADAVLRVDARRLRRGTVRPDPRRVWPSWQR